MGSTYICSLFGDASVRMEYADSLHNKRDCYRRFTQFLYKFVNDQQLLNKYAQDLLSSHIFFTANLTRETKDGEKNINIDENNR